MSDQQLLEKINELKIRIREIVLNIQGIKGQLERSSISLEEFRAQKTILEEELRNILQQIAEIKEKTEFKITPRAEKPTSPVKVEPIQIKEEHAQIEKKDQEAEVNTSELIDREIQIAGEAKELMYYFQTEFIESVSNVKIYLSITLEDHFIIGIDFNKYPERPILDIPTEVLELFNNDLIKFYTNLPIYSNWNIENPGRIYELTTEIETVLIRVHNADINTILKKSVEFVDKEKEKLDMLIKAVKKRSIDKDYKQATELCYSIIDLASELQDYDTVKTYTTKLDKFKKKLS